MEKKLFTQKIIDWYHDNMRILPWRETKDPYKIWLSEIILQQTRVAQGIPYYLKFIERFPTVHQLANAEEQDVLRLWQGLGYYTRARNLYRCAKEIVAHHDGEFPRQYDQLLKLPGIGAYTAAAIASIAFKEPVAVVDGNVFRVLARVFGIDKDISEPATRNYFFEQANQLISKEYPDDFNQGVMEFGATWCLPQNPKCDNCMLNAMCFAYANDCQRELPVKTKKVKSRKRYLYYFVIRHNKKLLLKKRGSKDIWQGLYDFHSEESAAPATPAAVMKKSLLLKNFAANIEIGEPSMVYKHILTHQTLMAQFIPMTFKGGEKAQEALEADDFKFYNASEIRDLPKPLLMDKHLSDIGFL